jgi:hypothetical protein
MFGTNAFQAVCKWKDKARRGCGPVQLLVRRLVVVRFGDIGYYEIDELTRKTGLKEIGI